MPCASCVCSSFMACPRPRSSGTPRASRPSCRPPPPKKSRANGGAVTADRVRLGKNPAKPKTRILATGNDAVRIRR